MTDHGRQIAGVVPIADGERKPSMLDRLVAEGLVAQPLKPDARCRLRAARLPERQVHLFLTSGATTAYRDTSAIVPVIVEEDRSDEAKRLWSDAERKNRLRRGPGGIGAGSPRPPPS